jgi:hypothetical protein
MIHWDDKRLDYIHLKRLDYIHLKEGLSHAAGYQQKLRQTGGLRPR